MDILKSCLDPDILKRPFPSTFLKTLCALPPSEKVITCNCKWPSNIILPSEIILNPTLAKPKKRCTEEAIQALQKFTKPLTEEDFCAIASNTSRSGGSSLENTSVAHRILCRKALLKVKDVADIILQGELVVVSALMEAIARDRRCVNGHQQMFEEKVALLHVAVFLAKRSIDENDDCSAISKKGNAFGSLIKLLWLIPHDKAYITGQKKYNQDKWMRKSLRDEVDLPDADCSNIASRLILAMQKVHKVAKENSLQQSDSVQIPSASLGSSPTLGDTLTN